MFIRHAHFASLDCHAYARNDKRVGTPTPERTPIQGVLIHGMCNFEDGTRAARRREKRTPSLTKSTSERTSLDSFRPRTSGIRRELYLSMRVLSVVPRYAVTVGSLKAHRGGTVIGKTLEERGNCNLSSRTLCIV